jgi:hypothetical protein
VTQRMLHVSSTHFDLLQHPITMPNYSLSYFTGSTPLLLNVHLFARIRDLFNNNNVSHCVSSSVALHFKIVLRSHLTFRVHTFFVVMPRRANVFFSKPLTWLTNRFQTSVFTYELDYDYLALVTTKRALNPYIMWFVSSYLIWYVTGLQ